MLEVKISYVSVSNGIPITDQKVEGEIAVDELNKHVDNLANLPDLASYEGNVFEGGVEGERGFFTARSANFVLHSYFIPDDQFVNDKCVRIELMQAENASNSTDSSQDVTGLLTILCLKELLRRMDRNEAPVEYALANTHALDGSDW